MYNTPTAAAAAALADYLRTKQLRALAYANYSALASIGYNLIDAEFKAAAAKALAVGVISWDEYKQALGA